MASTVFTRFSELPVELQVVVLHRVDPRTLLRSCLRVCKSWSAVISRSVFWTNVMRAQRSLRIPTAVVEQATSRMEWEVAARLVLARPFGRNLLRNCCGEECDVFVEEVTDQVQTFTVYADSVAGKSNPPRPEFAAQHWVIRSSAGEGWSVRKLPTEEVIADTGNFCLAANPDKEHLRRCYRTSDLSCSKSQLIDLRDLGLVESLLETVDIQVHYREFVKVTGEQPIYEHGIDFIYEQGITHHVALERYNQTRLGGSNWKLLGIGPLRVKSLATIGLYHGGIDVAMTGAELYLDVTSC